MNAPAGEPTVNQERTMSEERPLAEELPMSEELLRRLREAGGL
jgi:hypothetical protein